MIGNLVKLIVCGVSAGMLSLSVCCSYLGFLEQTTINPDGTTTTEKVWDADVAQFNVDKVAKTVDTVAESTGTSGLPFAKLISGALAIISCGLGIVAEWQRRDKNNLVATLKTTVKSAGDMLENEKIGEFVKTVKEIQEANATREIVKKSLTVDDNIANLSK